MTNNHTDMVPFRIEIKQAEIDRLHRHLDETRWPPMLPGDSWDTGVPLGWLRELSEYWRNEYDWRGFLKVQRGVAVNIFSNAHRMSAWTSSYASNG